MARPWGWAFHARGLCRGGVALLLLCAQAGLGVAPALAQEAPPLRVGVYHPAGDFCRVEWTPRNLRVMRLAFGLDDGFPARISAPWFYTPVTPDDPAAGLQLQAEALWGFPLAALQPAAHAGTTRHPLWPWLLRLQGALPDLSQDALLESGTLRWNGSAAPWGVSRLRSAALLPFANASDQADPTAPCVQWPLPVEWRRDGAGFRLDISLPQRPSLRLQGYARRSDLWRDLRARRLDAALLETGDLGDLAPSRVERESWQWAQMVGTQQVVLRFRTAVAAQLQPAGRAALSMALDRAGDASRARMPPMLPAQGYFHPVRPSRAAASGSMLTGDTRRARRAWLQQAEPPEHLTLVVLKVPSLLRLARELAAHWQRTLNLRTTVNGVPPEQLGPLLATAAYDVWLDVVDLEDGSLQALWRDALDGQTLAPAAERDSAHLDAWETLLQEQAPYLPLLGNAHALVTRGSRADEAQQVLCPACNSFTP